MTSARSCRIQLRKRSGSPFSGECRSVERSFVLPRSEPTLLPLRKMPGSSVGSSYDSEIFRGALAPLTEMARRGFATRVMAGIVAREEETGRGGELRGWPCRVCFAVSSWLRAHFCLWQVRGSMKDLPRYGKAAAARRARNTYSSTTATHDQDDVLISLAEQSQ